MAVDDSNTKSLLHFEGSDASTTFTDETGKTWTAYGNAQIDTAQKKFGSASGLFDGTGDYIDTPDHADFNFGTGDFTIDCWVRWNALPAAGNAMQIWSQGTSSTSVQQGYLYHRASPDRYELFYDSWSDASTYSSFSYIVSPSTNTWYHLAWIRNGTNWYVSFNGILSSASSKSYTVPDLSSTFRIGYSEAFGINHNGWIDEFRISKGIARWTRNFNVYGLAYSLSADCAGGDILQDGTTYYHVFPQTGTFTPALAGNVATLVVGGGGGGGGSGGRGGGGGAGEAEYNATFSVTAQAYTITVGAGGTGGVSGGTNSTAGGDSSFSTITGLGGGRGGGEFASGGSEAGGNGGCGGGAAAYYNQSGGTGNPGYNGGNGTLNVYGAGGGGGMGGVGANGSGNDGGAGGAGVDYSAQFGTTFGASGWFSGGGGGGFTGTGGSASAGGGAGASGAGTAGTPNTGGGGGGGGGGGVGGTGVVIIKYTAGSFVLAGGNNWPIMTGKKFWGPRYSG